MTVLSDNAMDALLNYIGNNDERLVICSAEPANYAGVAAVTLGEKTGITISAPANGDTSGRKVTVSAITDGSITATGTATHFAIVKDSATAELLFAGALSSSQAVTNGNTFTTPAFDIENPDPA